MDAGVSHEAETVTRPFADELRAIVAPEHARAAGVDDAVAGVQPRIVAEPANEQELASVLRVANQAGLAVIPRGGGSKLGWGNPPKRADLVLSIARLNRVREHAWADLTVTVEAGCTMQKLQETLAQHGQRLAIDPLWPERATIGGILSTNDSGALRLRFGALRDLVIGVTLALPDGTLASSGGKVVKNVAGYDLPKLATGAMGTLGVITRAVFRLHPVPRNSRSFTISPGDLGEAQRLILSIQDSKLAHTSLQLRISDETAPEVDVLFEGTEAGIGAQQAQIRHLAGSTRIKEVESATWNAREELWSVSHAAAAASDAGDFAVAKCTMLPAAISASVEAVSRLADVHRCNWAAVIQATGIAWLHVAGSSRELAGVLQSLRSAADEGQGSLTVLRRPGGFSAFESWGNPGNALPLMRAVKTQFDPKSTLNPGRFVGGI